MLHNRSGYGMLRKTGHIHKIGILCISLNLCVIYGSGAGIKETSATYDRALNEILNLNNITAGRIIENENKRYSDSVNMYLEYLENWNNAIETVLYEDQSAYEKYLKSFDSRLGQIEKKADKTSPSYHILLAEIYAQGGMVQLFYHDNLSGLIKILKSNYNARINMEKYPDYWLNKKLCGILNVSLDQMSPFLKKIAGIFNISGNPKTGFMQLSEYLKYVEDYPGLKSDALLYYGFALRIAKNDEKGYALFKQEIIPGRSPVLNLFLFSNLMCLTGRNEEASTLLTTIADRNFESPFPFKDYLYGKVILNHLDPRSDIYLKRFLMNSKSKNFKREICCKLSDYYLMNSNPGQFNYYRKQINNYARATTDRDREADVELNRPYEPSIALLKSSYLIQGGYYTEAAGILNIINPDELSLQAYKNEYYLLMAKIEFNSGRLNEALVNCDMAISRGKNCNEHYPAEAALLAGDISLKTGNKDKAEKYYKIALEIKGQNDVYIEIIEKMARNRLNNV